MPGEIFAIFLLLLSINVSWNIFRTIENCLIYPKPSYSFSPDTVIIVWHFRSKNEADHTAKIQISYGKYYNIFINTTHSTVMFLFLCCVYLFRLCSYVVGRKSCVWSPSYHLHIDLSLLYRGQRIPNRLCFKHFVIIRVCTFCFILFLHAFLLLFSFLILFLSYYVNHQDASI